MSEIFKQNKKIHTRFYRLKGKYNFKIGTKGSLYFLKSYSNSKSNKFILSKFKYIILHKWEKVFYFSLTLAIKHWLHLIFFTLYLQYKTKIYFFLDIIILFCILIFEILSFIALKKEYFNDIENIFDLFNIILSTTCLIIMYTKNDIFYMSTIFEVITLIIIFLKGMLFLKVFSKFRHLVNMIFKIFKGSLAPIFLMGYVIVALSIAFGRASDSNDLLFMKNFKINLALVFGELPDDDNNLLQWFLIIFVLIFAAIVMINFLIAKLTNEFSELEKTQKVFFYQDMAKMEYEFELIYKKFYKPDSDLKFCFFAIPLSLKSKNIDKLENFEDKLKKMEFRIQKNLEKYFLEINKKSNYHFKKNKLKYKQILNLIDSKK